MLIEIRLSVQIVTRNFLRRLKTYTPTSRLKGLAWVGPAGSLEGSPTVLLRSGMGLALNSRSLFSASITLSIFSAFRANICLSRS